MSWRAAGLKGQVGPRRMTITGNSFLSSEVKMYTYETTGNGFNILDPDGDVLFTVSSLGEVETALSHLNRGN
jgi:hypothetical protein